MIGRVWMSSAIGAFALAIAGTATDADRHGICGIDLTEATPSAAVSGQVKSVGLMVGLRWGNGVPTLSKGEQRKFRILGGKLLETGVAQNAFTGEVYNLINLASAPDIDERIFHRRAVEAAYWGIPIVDIWAMREAFERNPGSVPNTVTYFSKPMD